MNEIPECPEIGGCICYANPSGCVCGKTEKALRAWASPEAALILPMTLQQREWCLSEIDSVEGHSREDYRASTDGELARGVIGAWLDYCRDKGLL
jgi:hypothetical protein